MSNAQPARTPSAVAAHDALANLDCYQKELALSFRLGDWILWRKWLDTRIYEYGLNWIIDHRDGFTTQDMVSIMDPADRTTCLLRSLPVEKVPPKLTRTKQHYLYLSESYERYYADLTLGSDQYAQNFSSKSRSTLRRKVRKFAKACGGEIDWREYRTPDELEAFYPIARHISEKTYQENLLDAGLPSDDNFRETMLNNGANDAVRAYLLFDDKGQGLAYLYCPVNNGVVTYQHLGYVNNHELNRLSPGTVLLWLVLHRLQDEGCHQWFDFTEGSDTQATGQKSRFGTDSIQCADIWVLPRDARHAMLLELHRSVDYLSEGAGATLDSMGLKHRVKQWIRKRSGRDVK